MTRPDRPAGRQGPGSPAGGFTVLARSEPTPATATRRLTGPLVHYEPPSATPGPALFADEPAKASAPARSRSLDGLRGLAVLAILVYHAGAGMRGAFLAVSLFFTLSGFLITSLLIAEHRRNERIDLLAFWSRRFRRLLPAALVAVVVGALLVRWSGNATWEQSFRADGLAALGYSANWRFILSGQAYQSLFAAPSPVQHFWSLAIEEQLYLFLPVITIAALRLGRGSHRVLVAVFGVLFVVSAALPLVFRMSLDRFYFGTDTRAPEVLAGSILAAVLAGRGSALDTSFRLHVRHPRLIAGLGAIAGGLTLLGWFTTARGAPWVAKGGLAAFSAVSIALILGGLVPNTPVERVMSLRPLAWLGVNSYSIYLYHWPLYLMILVLQPQWPGLARLVVGGAGALVLGGASYRFLERPIQLAGVRAARAKQDKAIPRRSVGSVDRVRTSSPIRLLSFRVLAPLATVGTVVAVLAVTASTRPTAVTALDRPSGALVADLTRGSTGGPAPREVAPVPGATTRSVTATTQPSGMPPTKPLRLADRPLRLLVVGDSAAVMMLRAFNEFGAQTKAWEVSSYARIGCGLGRGGQRLLRDKAQNIPADCGDFASEWPAALAEVQPDVVVISDAFWDSIDRRFSAGAPWQRPGDPAYDDYLRAEFAEATDLLGSTGAAVVWMDNAPVELGRIEVPNRASDPANQPERMVRTNEIIHEVAATRPFVRVAPYARFQVAQPGGPYALRPDGLHVDDNTGPKVMAWLGPEIVDAYWQVKAAGR